MGLQHVSKLQWRWIVIHKSGWRGRIIVVPWYVYHSFRSSLHIRVLLPGSAIYVFGDKKNDHGLYGVVLDNGTTQIYDGISGCGGAFGMTCEQMKPTLAYFASNLDDSLHTLRIENMAGVNNSFFGNDWFYYSLEIRLM